MANSVDNSSNNNSKSNNNNNNGYQCTSPSDVFTVAVALSLLFAENLSKKEMETLINILALVVASLSAIVTQIEICQGQDIQPPI